MYKKNEKYETQYTKLIKSLNVIKKGFNLT